MRPDTEELRLAIAELASAPIYLDDDLYDIEVALDELATGLVSLGVLEFKDDEADAPLLEVLERFERAEVASADLLVSAKDLWTAMSRAIYDETIDDVKERRDTFAELMLAFCDDLASESRPDQ